jgi:hypothetical protein
MCHDPGYIAQLQADVEHFNELARTGDGKAFRSASETALELQSLGVKPRRPQEGIDPRLTVIDEPRARMGFVRT